MNNLLRSGFAKKVLAFAFILGLVSPSALAYTSLSPLAGVVKLNPSVLNLVAEVAPVIQNLNVTSTTGNAAISFTLNTTATTTVWIKNTTGTIVKTLIFDNSLVGGRVNNYTWNGTDNNNTPVASGSYTAQVVAYNTVSSDIKSFSFNYSTVATVVAPVVSLSVNPTSFDPSKGQSTTVSYSVSQYSSLSVLVKMSNGALVKTLRAQTAQNAGSYTLTWNGQNDQGTAVSPNNYTVEVLADNIAGSDLKTATVTVVNDVVTVTAPHLSSVSASPAKFNPNTESTRISYTIDKPASVTVTIWDGSFVIKTLSTIDPLNAGTYSYTWDGTDSSGNDVTDGSYIAKVTATNSAGTVAETTTVQVDLGRTNTCNSITSTYVYPSNVNINNTDAQINYVLSNSAFVTVRIKDTNGYLVRTLVSQSQSSGSQSVSWNGRNTNGNMVVSGSYTYEIMATGVSNCGTETETGSFYLTSNGSTGYVNDWASTDESLITNLLVTPEVFKPLDGERANISLYLNSSAKLRLEILNGTTVVRSIRDTGSSKQTSGTYSYTWDGRDNNGNLASDAVYQVRAMADDGSDTDTDRASVELDTDGIIIGFDSGERCAGFRDVSVNSPFCKAIELMSKRHIFEGYSDGTFRPYEKINRAETAKVVVLALDYDVNTSSYFGKLYRDTIAGAWYMPYLLVAKNNDIATGYPDGTFRPANTINRVELLRVFLEANHLSLNGSCDQPFEDTPVTSDTNWYMKYACYAKNNGLMNSDTSSKLYPADAMTRGDVANLFYDFEVKGLYNGVNGFNGFYTNNTTTTNSSYCTRYNSSGTCLQYSTTNNTCIQYNANGTCYRYGNSNNSSNSNGYYIYQNGQYVWVSY